MFLHTLTFLHETASQTQPSAFRLFLETGAAPSEELRLAKGGGPFKSRMRVISG